MIHRFERINGLAEVINARRYLEIGVNKGNTFNRITVPFKVAVDPVFLFDTKPYANDNTRFHQVPSDDFFATHAKSYQPFDIVYLDGLHTFEQTFRDFCASLSHCHRRTIWLIDDTCPINPASAEASPQRFRILQKQMKITNDAWMGDVFKVICAIHDFFPQMNFATFPEHGQTAIWFSPRTEFSPKWNSLQLISQLDFIDFLKLSDSIFKRTPPQKLLEMITQAFTNS